MNKKILRWWIAIGIIIAVLAAAAFIAARWLLPLRSAAGTETIGPGGWRISVNPGAIQRSTQLPQRDADALGLFVERKDSSLFLKKASGIPGEDVRNAPVIEVLVTHTTRIYRDVTLQNRSTPPQAGEQIDQVLEPSELDAVQAGNLVSVWGQKRGDRYLAEAIVFSAPIIKQN